MISAVLSFCPVSTVQSAVPHMSPHMSATDDINNYIVRTSTMDSLYKSRITASFHYNEIIEGEDYFLSFRPPLE